MPILSGLYRYPMKSTQAEPLSHARVTQAGLHWDRAFMVADLSGEMLTGRTHPALVQLVARVVDEQLQVTLPGREPFVLPLDLFSQAQAAQVWGTRFSAWGCAHEINDALSVYLATPVQLLYCGADSLRRVKTAPEISLSFADGYPFLLIGQASLDDLNQRLVQPVSMLNFRPNLVVSASEAFEEDQWRRICIGKVIFRLEKPCERCVFSKVDPHKAVKDAQQEPLRTLAHYRKTPAGVIFGQNLIAENSGEITQGMQVDVLEWI